MKQDKMSTNCKFNLTKAKQNKSKAFTLAEVLITLGIIGVVAVMVIPNLVQNYRQKMWNTASVVFERKLNESLKVMNTQGVIGQRITTENFINELAKYMKIIKICDNNHISDCFPSVFTTQIVDFDSETSSSDKAFNSSDFKKASDLKQSGGWTTNTMGVIFGDGVSAIIAYNDKTCIQDQFNNQFDGMSCLAIIYDTSGNALPNTMSKDVRSINTKLTSNFKFAGKYWGEPFKPTPVNHDECLEMKAKGLVAGCYVKNGAWWINYDSFWKTGDYWAGAVKKCGGLDKMPSQSDLTKLARTLYNDNNVKYWSENTNLSINTELASKISKTIPFTIWSNTNPNETSYGAGVTHSQKFDSTMTTGVGNGKTYSSALGICLSE